MRLNGVLVSISIILIINAVITRRELKSYQINLDLQPEERFLEVYRDFKEQIIQVKNHFLRKIPHYLLKLLGLVLSIRNEDEELNRELSALSKYLEIDIIEIRLLNYMYELTSIGGVSYLDMCIGVLGADSTGTIYHGRNFDLEAADYLNALLFNAHFYKNGKLIFIASMTAGYQGVITGMKPGHFAVSVNTRKYSTLWEKLNGISNVVYRSTPLNTWVVRKGLETVNSYREMKDILVNHPLSTCIYFILSGIDKNEGCVISRDSDKLANLRELEGNRFIVQANSDVWTKPKKDPRRFNAENYLKGVELTKESVFKAITLKGVQVDATIWQGVMSAKEGYFNSTSPWDSKRYFDNNLY